MLIAGSDVIVVFFVLVQLFFWCCSFDSGERASVELIIEMSFVTMIV